MQPTHPIINKRKLLSNTTIKAKQNMSTPEIIETTPKPEDLTPAERYYRNHLKRVCDYQRRNPEKMREKCKKWNAKVKAEQPEKYQAILEQKRKYYNEVRKPKLMAERLKKTDKDMNTQT